MCRRNQLKADSIVAFHNGKEVTRVIGTMACLYTTRSEERMRRKREADGGERCGRVPQQTEGSVTAGDGADVFSCHHEGGIEGCNVSHSHDSLSHTEKKTPHFSDGVMLWGSVFISFLFNTITASIFIARVSFCSSILNLGKMFKIMFFLRTLKINLVLLV